MACWTLWQRLPPRYQLTTKEIYDEPEPIASSPRSPRPPSSPRVKTPRPSSSPRVKTPRPSSSPRVRTPRSPSRAKQDTPRNKGQAKMYFAVSSKEEEIHSARNRTHSPPLAFPARRSAHIDNFKQQQRINSARQNFPDPSTATPRSNTPSLRVRTAPQFPVTRMSTHEARCPKHAPSKGEDHPKAPTPVKRRGQSKSAGVIRQNQQLSVNTIQPFEHKPYLKSPLYADKNTKRYYVRNLDNATMVIDDDKIVFIKRRSTKMGNERLRPDTAEDMSYLAHLRKLYLREPKDMVKLSKQSPQDKKTLIRERLEYDKKTDRILSYYSREDDIRYASAWTSAVEASRGQFGQETDYQTPRTARVHSSRESRRKAPSSPPRSAGRPRPASARMDPTAGPDSSRPVPDVLADWNMFLRINSQSILHDRKFYLQTPAFGANGSVPVNEDETKDCACRICKIEQEVALFRQQHPNAVIVLSEPQIEYETGIHEANDTSTFLSDSSQLDPSYKRNYADGHTKTEDAVSQKDTNEKAILAVANATQDANSDREHAKKPSSETLNLCIDLSTGSILSPAPIDSLAPKDHQDENTKSSNETEGRVSPMSNTSNKNTQTDNVSPVNGLDLSGAKTVEGNSSPETRKFVSENSTSDLNVCIDRLSPNARMKGEESGLITEVSEQADCTPFKEKPLENYQVFKFSERGQSDVNVTPTTVQEYSLDMNQNIQSEPAGILGNDNIDNVEK